MNITLCLLLFAAAPDAQLIASEQPAIDYAHGSVSAIGSASLGVGLFGASQNGSPFQAIGLTSGIALRVVTKRGFAFEPRVGLDGLLTTGAAGFYAILAGRLGLGVGWAFSLTPKVALTPLVAYEAMYLAGGLTAGLSGLAHTGAVELPLTFFFSKDSFVEVYVRGGATLLGGQAAPTFAAGYRFGRVW